MRNKKWEKAIIEHQQLMIRRLDDFRKLNRSNACDADEKMIIEYSFQLLVASMLDLAKYVLEHHYQTPIQSRQEVLQALLDHSDITYEQGEQMKTLIKLREKVLFDYLDENFHELDQSMNLRGYKLVEVLSNEWILQLEQSNTP